MFDKNNFKMGGAAALAVIIALNLTEKNSKLVQGGASVLAAMGALYLAQKI